MGLIIIFIFMRSFIQKVGVLLKKFDFSQKFVLVWTPANSLTLIGSGNNSKEMGVPIHSYRKKRTSTASESKMADFTDGHN